MGCLFITAQFDDTPIKRTHLLGDESMFELQLKPEHLSYCDVPSLGKYCVICVVFTKVLV